jgi:hypothetical protein
LADVDRQSALATTVKRENLSVRCLCTFVNDEFET